MSNGDVDQSIPIADPILRASSSMRPAHSGWTMGGDMREKRSEMNAHRTFDGARADRCPGAHG